MLWSRAKNTLKIRNCYLRLKKHRGHKKAIIAIARMLLTAIYHILKDKKPYDPSLYQVTNCLPTTREISIEQAILLANSYGYHVNPAS